MSKRNYIVWELKAAFDFPAAETPESMDAWWDESGPDFTDWVECESETLVCECVSLEDLDIVGDGRVEVTYSIHLSFDLAVPYEDATEELNGLPDILPPDGWTLDSVSTIGLKHYAR
jgi:hypothetical protein